MNESSIMSLLKKKEKLEGFVNDFPDCKVEYQKENSRLMGLLDELLLSQAKSKNNQSSDGVNPLIISMEKMKKEYAPLDNSIVTERLTKFEIDSLSVMPEDTSKQIEEKINTIAYLKDNGVEIYDEKTLEILKNKRMVASFNEMPFSTCEEIDMKISRIVELYESHPEIDTDSLINDFLSVMPEETSKQLEVKISTISCLKENGIETDDTTIETLDNKRMVALINEMPGSTCEEIDLKILRLVELHDSHPEIDTDNLIKCLYEEEKKIICRMSDSSIDNADSKIEAFRRLKEKCPEIDVDGYLVELGKKEKRIIDAMSEQTEEAVEAKIQAYEVYQGKDIATDDVQDTINRLRDSKLYVTELNEIDQTMPETTCEEIEEKIRRINEFKELHKSVDVEFILLRLTGDEKELLNKMPCETLEEIDRKLEAYETIRSRMPDYNLAEVKELKKKRVKFTINKWEIRYICDNDDTSLVPLPDDNLSEIIIAKYVAAKLWFCEKCILGLLGVIKNGEFSSSWKKIPYEEIQSFEIIEHGFWRFKKQYLVIHSTKSEPFLVHIEPVNRLESLWENECKKIYDYVCYCRGKSI